MDRVARLLETLETIEGLEMARNPVREMFMALKDKPFNEAVDILAVILKGTGCKVVGSSDGKLYIVLPTKSETPSTGNLPVEANPN